MRARHVAIIGAGNVGATTAYALLQSDLVEKLSLIDINSAKAEGEALDLQDGVSFLHPTTVRWGDYELCRGARCRRHRRSQSKAGTDAPGPARAKCRHY